jgi:cystathionine beta-lyase/cystathionine gamma-synthase
MKGVASTYTTLEELKKAGKFGVYERYGYPECEKMEREIARLIGIKQVLLYNSGMAAIHDALFFLLQKGDTLLYSPYIYPETRKLIERDFSRFVNVVKVPRMEELEKLIKRTKAKVIFTETVGNHFKMPMVNVEELFEIAEETDVSLVLDNTLPSEALPLAAQIQKVKVPVVVVHSATKSLAQNQITMGLAYTNSQEVNKKIYELRMRTGNYLPRAALELLPKMTKEELESRYRRLLRNTKKLAEALYDCLGKFGIKAVSYPNLPNHPQHSYAEKVCPDGTAPIFFVRCENSWKTAAELEKFLGIEFGPSFGLGFTKSRLIILSRSLIRIAGGEEE